MAPGRRRLGRINCVSEHKLKDGALLKELLGVLAGEDGQEPSEDDAAYAVVHKAADLRYTFGPMYAPGVLDEHGEFTDEDELRKAVWDFFENGDKELRKQHGRERVGTIVSLVQWPYEHEAELSVPGGTVRKVKFPSGTVYAGVRWTEEAWPLVKSGAIKGYSMGGAAVRVRDADASGVVKLP